MKVLVWNIQQGGGLRKARIAKQIQLHDPHVILLLEFIPADDGAFPKLFRDTGWPHSICTQPQGRDYSICVMSKTGIATRSSGLGTLDQSGLWLEVILVDHELSLGVVHVPTTDNRKRPYCDALVEFGRLRQDESVLLVGDFNTGVHPIDGDLQSLGCVNRFVALQELGFTDAWRHFNGDRREFSLFRRGKGFRIDHALVSPAALPRVTGCYYSHNEREQGMSDHSALIVEICCPGTDNMSR